MHFALRGRGAGAENYSGEFAISTHIAVKLVRFSLRAANTQQKPGSEAVSEQVLTFEELQLAGYKWRDGNY